jgi:hypothetical protein
VFVLGGGEAQARDPDFSDAYLIATKVLTPPAGSTNVPLTTLTFYSGIGTTAVVEVLSNGTKLAQIGAQGSGAKGVKTYPITPGHTFTFRLLAIFTQDGESKRKTLKVVTVKTLPCIKAVSVVPHGLGAEVRVETEVPSSLLLQIGTTASFTKMAWAGFSLVQSTTHVLAPVGLRAGSTYHYTVTAKVDGTKYTQTGTFRTLYRKVHVRFHQIKVHDDSDATGSGELAFSFYTGKPGGGDFKEAFRLRDLGSGDLFLPKIDFYLSGVGDRVPILVNALENDSDRLCPFGRHTRWWEPPNEPRSPGDCKFEFAYVRATLDASPNNNGQETYSESFHYASKPILGSSLKFTVWGHFTVSYFKGI